MNILKEIRACLPPSKKSLYRKLEGIFRNQDVILKRQDVIFWFLKQKPGKTIEETQLEFYKNLAKEEKHFKNIQMIILSIMKFYDKVCRENNLGYWLWSGTLLGAVRHGGFIPWDEDADIGMLRADFEKFKEAIKSQSRYKLVDFYEAGIRPKSCGRFAKLVDTECPFCIYLDVFPFDLEMVKDSAEASARYYARRKKLEKEIWNESRKLGIKAESRPIEGTNAKKRIDEIFDKYLNKSLNNSLTINTPNVSLQWGIDLFRAPYIRRWPCKPDTYDCGRCIYPLQNIKFEDLNAMVPNDPKYILDLSFDDWLSLPHDAYSHFHSNYFDFGNKDYEVENYVKKGL